VSVAPLRTTVRDLPRALAPSAWIAAVLIVIVGFTGSLPLVVDVATRANLDAATLSSWVWSIVVGSGVLSLGLSLAYRKPVLTAWSTPGLAVLGTTLVYYPLSAAIGAYIAGGIVIVVLGATGLFDRVLALVPQTTALAVLAGVLLHYCLAVFSSLGTDAALVLPPLVTFLIARWRGSRLPMAWVLAVGFCAAALTGDLDLGSITLALAVPKLITPTFDAGAIVAIGVPLLALALAAQDAPGFAVMRAAGYEPPTRGALVATGGMSTVLAPLGCHGLTLAAITQALATNEEAHPDPDLRYGAGVAAGILKIGLGIFGATVISVFLALPHALVAGLAGLALLGTFASSLTTAIGEPSTRESALIAFLVTASDLHALSLGGAFWGLVAGGLVHVLIERRPKSGAG
jgi:benzoate membrane transport protein